MGHLINHVLNLIGTQASPSALTTAYTGNTFTLAIEGIEQVDLELYFTPSNTNSQLDWKVEFSDDGTYFYGEDFYTTSTTVRTHGATNGIHQWTPGVASLVQRNITIDSLGAKYIKISFKYNTNGGSLWANIATKEIVSR